jgi:hypothetical protein
MYSLFIERACVRNDGQIRDQRRFAEQIDETTDPRSFDLGLKGDLVLQEATAYYMILII